MLVDSHCHLDFKEFAPELDDVVGRARDAGVRTCVTIGTKLRQFDGVRAVAERFGDVWCSVGVHPHEAQAEPLDSPDVLVAHAAHPKVVGIGETGLDYYYEHSPREMQIANFRHHIHAARETGLPLIVHTRDADDDTIPLLEEEMARAPYTGLLHCFTGTRRLAEAAVALGLYISVSGIATFKKSDELRAVLKDVPRDRLLVETDAPFLSPQPFRGKRNEPSFVVHTAAMLAALHGVSADEIARITTENFFRLFTKVARPRPTLAEASVGR
ncbi:MAG: TatD family hydrolase [Alphaproteobacteria bacterium]|nr:TatD family hydrolase [Alphaproteobacteria bacterium]